MTARELVHLFAEHASARSIGRLLARLVAENKIAIRGAGPSTRYLPRAEHRAPTARLADAALQANAEDYVPVSTDSALLRERVRRTPAQRRPIGYDRTLLESYRPNQTFYLGDEASRTRLAELGRTPVEQRPAGTSARDILSRLLIDLAWASSRLEGNTYTRLDTLNLIQHNREAEGRDRRETQMILNHKRAIEFLIEPAEDIGFNLLTFMNLHGLLSENLLTDPAASGRLRERVVEISGTVYRPLGVPQQIHELFRSMLDKAAAIRDPFEQAFFVMVHVPHLRPFEDVNKCVSRLAANIPFFRANLCPLSFIDVPERAYVDATLAVYEHGRVALLRDVFMWAYERSCEQFKAVTTALPEPDPFRLKYRAELADAVAGIVRSGGQSEAASARSLANTLIPADDRPRFIKLVLDELRGLHEGNLARYRLRLGEFRGWKANRQ